MLSFRPKGENSSASDSHSHFSLYCHFERKVSKTPALAFLYALNRLIHSKVNDLKQFSNSTIMMYLYSAYIIIHPMKLIAFKVLRAAIIIILLSRVCYSQTTTLTLTFSAVENTQYIELENIRIVNLDKDCDTILYWNDTVLVLDYVVGIHDHDPGLSGFDLLQNHPNPVVDQSRFNVYIPQQGELSFIITDTWGREHLVQKQFLDQGNHTFSLIPGGEDLYFLTAYYKGNSRSIKILNASGKNRNNCTISHLGSSDRYSLDKAHKYRSEKLYACRCHRNHCCQRFE